MQAQERGETQVAPYFLHVPTRAEVEHVRNKSITQERRRRASAHCEQDRCDLTLLAAPSSKRAAPPEQCYGAQARADEA